ncbi:MAG: single-stranded DNA-binding protein [Cyclobacteriaceae bacterium]
MSVNKVILVGRLGKDPEVRSTESGRKVANFSLATSESYRDKNSGERVENTDWHNIVFWGPTAEIVERYLSKGRQIYVEGKLKTRSYEDKDGNTRYVTEVLGQQLTMLGGKEDGGAPNNNASATPATAPAQNKVAESAPAADVDDLPF